MMVYSAQVRTYLAVYSNIYPFILPSTIYLYPFPRHAIKNPLYQLSYLTFIPATIPPVPTTDNAVVILVKFK